MLSQIDNTTATNACYLGEGWAPRGVWVAEEVLALTGDDVRVLLSEQSGPALLKRQEGCVGGVGNSNPLTVTAWALV